MRDAAVGGGGGRPAPGHAGGHGRGPPAMSRFSLMVLICAAVATAMFAASLFAGSVWLDPAEVWRGLFSPRPDLAALIVTELRLPRAVLALGIGAVLGLS